MAAFFTPGGLLFKRVLLLFSALYFTITALSNMIDFMDAVGTIHWTFLNSRNLVQIDKVTAVYHASPFVGKLLLVGVVAVATVGAYLFWRALFDLRAGGIGIRRVYAAHIWAAFVWIMFILASEFFVSYSSEAVFRELLVVTILSMLSVTIVPDALPKPSRAAD